MSLVSPVRRSRVIVAVVAAVALTFGGVLATAPAEAATTKTFSKVGTPTISGTAKVGSTLKAKPGTWKPKPSKVTYTWYLGSKKLGSGASFKVPASAAGKKITVKATASLKGYKTTTSKASKATKAVAKGTFSKVGKPAISGTATVGSTVKATPGTWSPKPSKITYAWYTGTAKIGSGASFKIPASAAGKKLTVKATATLKGYATKTSAASAAKTVAAGTLAGGALALGVSGATTVTVTPSLTQTSPAGVVAYEWFIGSTKVGTGSSYTFTRPTNGASTVVRAVATVALPGYTPKTFSVNTPVIPGYSTVGTLGVLNTSPAAGTGETRVVSASAIIPAVWPAGVTLTWTFDGAPIGTGLSVTASVPNIPSGILAVTATWANHNPATNGGYVDGIAGGTRIASTIIGGYVPPGPQTSLGGPGVN